jgi:hypothetical protein
MGYPMSLTDPDNVERIINEYFNDIDKRAKKGEKVSPTMSGLAYALDMDRLTLVRYGQGEYKDKDDNQKRIYNSIKKGKARLEAYSENYLYNGARTIGAIFSLKNNYAGWEDRVVNQNENKTIIVDIEEE